MRIAAWMALVALALAACGPAGVVANSVVKESQGSSAAAIERDLKARFAAEPALNGVKASVAIGNVWQDAFQTRTSVLLAGTVVDAGARDAAIAVVRQVVGGDQDAVLIADHMRIKAD